jgi:hypothetical protein
MLGRRLWVIRPTRGRSRRQRSESLKPFDNTCHSVSYSLSFSQDADARQTSSYPSHLLSLSLFHHSRHDAYTLTTTQAYELTVYCRQSLTRIISSSHSLDTCLNAYGRVHAPPYTNGRTSVVKSYNNRLLLVSNRFTNLSLPKRVRSHVRSRHQTLLDADDVEMKWHACL